MNDNTWGNWKPKGGWLCCPGTRSASLRNSKEKSHEENRFSLFFIPGPNEQWSFMMRILSTGEQLSQRLKAERLRSEVVRWYSIVPLESGPCPWFVSGVFSSSTLFFFWALRLLCSFAPIIRNDYCFFMCVQRQLCEISFWSFNQSFPLLSVVKTCSQKSRSLLNLWYMLLKRTQTCLKRGIKRLHLKEWRTFAPDDYLSVGTRLKSDFRDGCHQRRSKMIKFCRNSCYHPWFQEPELTEATLIHAG